MITSIEVKSYIFCTYMYILIIIFQLFNIYIYVYIYAHVNGKSDLHNNACIYSCATYLNELFVFFSWGDVMD